MPTPRTKLLRLPIWEHQADESQRQFDAFWAWLVSDGARTPAEVLKEFNLSKWVADYYRWEERADAYWADFHKRLTKPIEARLQRLRLQAIDAALTLTTQQETVDITAKSDGTLTTTTRQHLPNAGVVSKILEKMLDKEPAHDIDGDQTARLLEAMVQATIGGDEPPDTAGDVQHDGAL